MVVLDSFKVKLRFHSSTVPDYFRLLNRIDSYPMRVVSYLDSKQSNSSPLQDRPFRVNEIRRPIWYKNRNGVILIRYDGNIAQKILKAVTERCYRKLFLEKLHKENLMNKIETNNKILVLIVHRSCSTKLETLINCWIIIMLPEIKQYTHSLPPSVKRGNRIWKIIEKREEFFLKTRDLEIPET